MNLSRYPIEGGISVPMFWLSLTKLGAQDENLCHGRLW